MNPETRILNANSQFCSNLYKILAHREGNIFFSPISLHTVLSMLYMGAQEQTAQVLEHTLNNPDIETTAEGYGNAIQRLETMKHVTLLTANKIYSAQKFQKKFEERLEKYFRAHAEIVETKEAKREAEKVNKWVEEKTQKCITNIVDEKIFEKNLSLLLINAIYFKGEWVSKFKVESTKTEKFYVNDETAIEVEMMKQKGNFWYKEDEDLGVQVLEMPYKGFDTKMMIILPLDNKIEKLEEKLVKTDINSIAQNMKRTDVHVSLPKFKMEETIQLNDVLSDMGLKTIFDPNKANFKGIIDTFDPTRNLYVSDVIQKAFIEVNEGGTVAAAATKAALVLGCAPGVPKTEIFRVDHPAIFLLLTTHGDKKTLNVLFFGRLSNPKF